MNKDKSIRDLKQYNDKIKTQLEYSKSRVWILERENDRLTNELNTCMIERNNFLSRIEKTVDFINKHCVNHKVSKEVGFKVYTIMVTDELEKVMKILER